MATATQQAQSTPLQHPSIPRKIAASAANVAPLTTTKPTNSLYLRDCPPSHLAGSDYFSGQQFYRIYCDINPVNGPTFRIFAEIGVASRRQLHMRQFKIVGADVDEVGMFTPVQRLPSDLWIEINAQAVSFMRFEIRDEIVAKLEELEAIDGGWTFG